MQGDSWHGTSADVNFFIPLPSLVRADRNDFCNLEEAVIIIIILPSIGVWVWFLLDRLLTLINLKFGSLHFQAEILILFWRFEVLNCIKINKYTNL